MAYANGFRAALLASSAVAVAYASPALAQSRAFDVPAGPASNGITAFAEQADIQILVVEAATRGKQTRAVQGTMTAEAGLRQLLIGSGLSIIADDGRTVTLSADPQSASAGGDVDALIVTAQKREENIQDVPIAISAFSQEDLTRSQVAGGPDLMTQVPNMTFTKTNFSSYSIQIRGIGTQAISATTDPAVAVAFNNTPFVRNHFFEQEFYDLQRVEVLRGPQGTLYGRNATAGVVNVISAKPSNRFEARLSGDVSNYSSSRLEGMVNLPLIEDKVALRIAGAWTKRAGFVKNILTGEQTDGRNLWSARVTLGLEPTDWLSANLIYEHFEENDDRLRTGKQLCHSDPGPLEVNGVPVDQNGSAIMFSTFYFSQGCKPASMYSPDSFDTPNGFALPYYGAAGQLGSPVYVELNPYASQFQSRNLREIETHLTPDYEASADVVELQLSIDLPGDLSLTSETGFSRDFIFSFSDFNRFDTTPNVFKPGGVVADDFALIDADGFFCDPQLGCTNRLAAGDLATARSQQFSQEFRLSSDFDGPFNFGLGANFLRYDTEDKYYVFINTLTSAQAFFAGPQYGGPPWEPGVSDASHCVPQDFYGPVTSNPNAFYTIDCGYIDPNDVHNLNDQGRNYFLSRNPYHLLSYAAFGEAYYNITPDLKLTAGLRWTVDKKTAPQMPSWLLAGYSYGNPVRKVINLEWREPTGRIALDWKPELSFTDETLLYASYVRGYKAGGANPPPPIVVLVGEVCPPSCGGDADLEERILAKSLTHPETFDAEFVDAFEVGTKNTLLDGRLTANLSAFYYDYRGYQISQIVNRSAVNLNFDAKIWGAELEVDWRPLENLRLGFKGGYENTRMAEGSQAIDLMDRVAGQPGWILVRPFPPLATNCVVPIWLPTAASFFGNLCSSYLTGLDPATNLPYVPDPEVWLSLTGIQPLPPELADYPGYNPAAAPNNGEGFLKDLSGNELPNAPDFTATITADYTIPLPHDWLVTLHTDLYYQSEAWTRIFNTEGYDKLKAYNNINFAAIFSNEDAGWMVMAYVKNVLDRDSITGAFLNSDDTGLTTNVFLTEPRLYGIRVTKEWTGGPLIGGFGAGREGPFPLTVEFGGQVQRQDAPNEAFMPFADAFSSALDPRQAHSGDLDWTDGREGRLIYQPSGSPWKISAGVRYGRTSNAVSLRREEVAGDTACITSTQPKYDPLFPGVDFGFQGKLRCDPDYAPVTLSLTLFGQTITRTFPNLYNPDNLLTPINRVGASTSRREEHGIVDFVVGKDVGLGLGADRSLLSAGVRIAQFKSSTSSDMIGVPDLYVPDGWGENDTTFHRYVASFESEREFAGAGPTLSWEAARRLWGNEETGHLSIDWTLTGGALFGKQKTTATGTQGSEYFAGYYPVPPVERYPVHLDGWSVLPPTPQTPMSIAPRNTSATVPVLDLSLGLSFEVPGVKISTGYRWERYFNVLDAGSEEHKSYDRTIDGPYFRLAIGLGG